MCVYRLKDSFLFVNAINFYALINGFLVELDIYLDAMDHSNFFYVH